jgi:hypothetical protein
VTLEIVGTSVAWWRGWASGRLYSVPLEDLRRRPVDPLAEDAEPKVYVRRRPSWHFHGLSEEFPWAVVERSGKHGLHVEAFRSHDHALAAALIVSGAAGVEPCS